MKRLLNLLIAFYLAIGSSFSQTTAGTEFWLGYMENLNLAFNDTPEFAVIINTDIPTSGAIEIPSTGLSIPFSVGAGSTEIFLPQAIYYTEASEQIDNKGIRIISVSPVQVQAYHYRLFFTESTSLLPTTALGTEYLVTTIADEQGAEPASLVIVATEDNTQIEITPTALTLGLRPAGVPFTVTLNEGQNYQVQSSGELTGSRVRSLSANPIAVFAGSRQANIVTPSCPNGIADSHVWDQSVPIDDWRDLYYFAPFAGQGGDRVRVVAASDDTDVFFDCEHVATLDTGAFYETQRDVATVISATGPISVSQYTNSFSCEPQELGDPNGLSYLPADFLGTNFRWYASDRGADLGSPQFSVHWATIVGPEDHFANLTVDGAPFSNLEEFPGDPSWNYAYASVGAGDHQIIADAGLQVYAYGFGFADAYTNNLGYNLIEPQEYVCLEIDREGILCIDSLQNFTYTSNVDLVDFSWDFGDNSTSIAEFATNSYNILGQYEVTLTATTTNGTTVTSNTLTFVVLDCGDDPCAGQSADIFPFEGGNGCANYLQSFDFIASFETTSVNWDFGDGTPSVSEENPEHFFSSAGEYTVTLTLENTLGCFFSETLFVTITECDPCQGESVPDITISGDFCVGETLVFDPNYEAAGIPLIMIDWQFSDGRTFDTETVTLSFTAPGIYTVFYTAMNAEGCFFDSAFDFIIESCFDPCGDLPSLTIVGPPPGLCVLTEVEFVPVTTANLVSYEWFVNDELRTSNPSLFYSFVLTGPQLITLNALDDNGCEYTAFYKLFVEDCPSNCDDLVINDVIIDGDLCIDSPFSITIDANADQLDFTLWTLEQTDLILSSSLNDLSFSTPGIYSFDFITFAEPGCFIDSTITVTIVDCDVDCSLFQLDGITIDGELCVGTPFNVTPQVESEILSSLWTLPDGTTSTNFTLQNISFDAPGPIDLQLALVDINGCELETTLQLIIEPCEPDCTGFQIANFDVSGITCVDSAFTISPVIFQDFSSVNWTLPDGSTSNNLSLTNLSFAESGSYAFQLQLNNEEGCEIDTSLQIMVEACNADCDDFQLSGFNISATCVNSPINITPLFDQDFTDVTWTFPDGSTSNEFALTNLSFTATGVVNLTIEINDDQGCSLDFTLQLTIEDCSSDPPPPFTGEECQVMFPNAFSPNDDGFNDRFQGFFAPECEPLTYNLMIFNRWGNQIYESSNPGEGWDGTFRGEPHQQEVLVYICQLLFPDGTSQEIKGDVVLIR